MAFGSDFKLRYQITADSSKAKAELKGFDAAIGKVSKSASGMGDVFGGVLGGNLASGAISQLTSSLVAGASAVFDYSSSLEQAKVSLTSIMGSAGAAAQHLEDLQKVSGSTPLQLASLAKMSQRLQGAGTEAQKVIPLIKDIGNVAAATGELTAERMEGIGVAFSQIASKGKVSAEEMEQLAERGIPAWRILSQTLGKTAAETRKLAEDGKITSDVMLDAFQKFSRQNYGDAMEKQAKTVAGSFGLIKNVVLNAAESGFKPFYDEIGRFGSKVADSLKQQEKAAGAAGVSFGAAIGEGIGHGLGRFAGDTSENGFLGILKWMYDGAYIFGKSYGKAVREGMLYAKGGDSPNDLPDESLFTLGPRLAREAKARSQPGAVPPGTVPRGTPNVINVKRADSQADFDRRKRANDERLENERIARVRESLAAEVAEKRASVGTLIALEKQRYAEGRITEEAAIRFRREHEVGLTSLVIDTKQRELDAIKGNADEEKRVKSELKILNAELEQQYAEYAENDADRIAAKKKAEKELHADRRKQWDEILEQIDKEIKAADAAASKRARASSEAGMVTAPGTFKGGIAAGMGVDLVSQWETYTDAFGNSVEVMRSQADQMKAIYADVADFAGGAIGGMIQGLGQMAIAWAVSGEGSAQAALQMMAATALSIAFQAGLKAFFEAAESAAAFARYDVVAGTAHATAATMYGMVASIAGAAGVGLAIGARFAGGGGSSGSKSQDSSVGSNRQRSENPMPSSRVSEDAFISGRRGRDDQLADAIRALNNKLDSVRAGDILVKGASQRPGFIGSQTVKDIGRNSGLGTGLRRVTGGR